MKWLQWAIIVSFLIFTPSMVSYAGDADVLYVPERIEFQKSAKVRGKNKDECNIQTNLANYIATNAKRVYGKVVRERPKSGKYHVLEAEVLSAEGAGGGSWSGPKSMEMQGKLVDQNGKRIGDFTATRFTTGGVFAGVKGTCTMFKRICKAFGKDIATFLADPDTAVHLGD